MPKCTYLMYAQNLEIMFFNAKSQQYIGLWQNKNFILKKACN